MVKSNDISVNSSIIVFHVSAKSVVGPLLVMANVLRIVSSKTAMGILV